MLLVRKLDGFQHTFESPSFTSCHLSSCFEVVPSKFFSLENTLNTKPVKLRVYPPIPKSAPLPPPAWARSSSVTFGALGDFAVNLPTEEGLSSSAAPPPVQLDGSMSRLPLKKKNMSKLRIFTSNTSRFRRSDSYDLRFKVGKIWKGCQGEAILSQEPKLGIPSLEIVQL